MSIIAKPPDEVRDLDHDTREEVRYFSPPLVPEGWVVEKQDSTVQLVNGCPVGIIRRRLVREPQP